MNFSYESSEDVDKSLKELILQRLPVDDSYGATLAIKSDECRNEIAKLILERAKLKLMHISDNYFRKPKVRVPFILDPFENARLVRERGNVSEIISVKTDRVTDIDFQVHKHAMIQSVIHNVCRPTSSVDEQDVQADFAFYDGFQPYDYEMFYPTIPTLVPLELDLEDPVVPDTTFTIVNLFDSHYTITTLYQAFNQFADSGSELFLIVPYDRKMWTITAANVLEGSYSYQWVTEEITANNTNEFVTSRTLPANFFRDNRTNAQLRIRPFRSNKILTLSRDEFIAIFAQGSDDQSFPETRQISHGFAEVSLISFYPVHQVNALAGIREIKGTNIPFNKRLIIPKTTFDLSPSNIIKSHLALSLIPPWPYIVEDKLYERTKKAAVQTRITRNMIVPLIYHLFAHSTHIVFNGAIVTIQKVMSPELICQLTEVLLFEIIPIKLKIIQAGHIIRANADLSKSQLAISAAKAVLICAYSSDSPINLDNITNTIYEIFTNPNFMASRGDEATETFQTHSAQNTPLDPIEE